jgi:hypothetical protein
MMKSFYTINQDTDILHAQELADSVQGIGQAVDVMLELWGNYQAALTMLNDAKVEHRLNDNLNTPVLDSVCTLKEIKILTEGDLDEANYTLQQKGIKQIALPTI